MKQTLKQAIIEVVENKELPPVNNILSVEDLEILVR